MKKILSFILISFFLLSFLSGCNLGDSSTDNTDSTAKGTETSIQTKTETSIQTKTDVEHSTNNDTDGPSENFGSSEPPHQMITEYPSRQDLTKALTNPKSKEYAEIRVELETYGILYPKLLSYFESGKIQLAVPMFDGNEVSFPNEENAVKLLSDEAFGLPWIWYGRNIRITYLSILEKHNFAPEDTHIDILKELSPSFGTPEKYDPTAFDYFYEDMLTLADGTEVSVMVTRFPEREEVVFRFRYQDLLIAVFGNEEMERNPEYWSKFGIVYE